MDDARRKALEASGLVFEDAEDFLELTPDERESVQERLTREMWERSARNLVDGLGDRISDDTGEESGAFPVVLAAEGYLIPDLDMFPGE